MFDSYNCSRSGAQIHHFISWKVVKFLKRKIEGWNNFVFTFCSMPNRTGWKDCSTHPSPSLAWWNSLQSWNIENMLVNLRHLLVAQVLEIAHYHTHAKRKHLTPSSLWFSSSSINPKMKVTALFASYSSRKTIRTFINTFWRAEPMLESTVSSILEEPEKSCQSEMQWIKPFLSMK